MLRPNAASAANWTLIALAVQLAAGLCMAPLGRMGGFALLLLCWLMSGYAALRLRCLAALGAAAAGAVLAVLSMAGISGWMVNIVSNLLFLLYYLPLQNAFDRKLAAADVSKGTRMLGRVWAYATLAQRGASMLGFLPYFDGQDVLSAQQGSYTTLFTVQLTLEMIALLAAIVSYVCMVRYLWRVRTLLRGEAV